MPFIRRKTLDNLKAELSHYKEIAKIYKSRSGKRLNQITELDSFILYLSENVEDYEGYVLNYMEKQENEDEVN
jgi:hypothetical protein